MFWDLLWPPYRWAKPAVHPNRCGAAEQLFSAGRANRALPRSNDIYSIVRRVLCCVREALRRVLSSSEAKPHVVSPHVLAVRL